MTLDNYFAQNPKGALAFSGGVDSAYLLWVCIQAGASLRPYFIKTPFQPRFELEDAQRLCKAMGTELTVIEIDILSDSKVASNPPDRCYYCKRRMFALLKERALRDGLQLLLEGTNVSDRVEDRPGMRALAELGVRSPLRECGLAKEDIRELSRQAGLFTWQKPSYACLATRVPAGLPIARESLKKVEWGETLLSGLGFRDFRLRLTAGGCKLQVLESQLPLVMEQRADLLSALEADFSEITLDLRPRIPTD